MTPDFEALRPFLRGLAYRMLGAVSEAEDILQDAWLRWHETERTVIHNSRAYLARVVTNLCLDQIASARARRECYVGQWLPEPLPDETLSAKTDPAYVLELTHDLSYALLQVLARLSPLERAAFLLHDIFEFDFVEIAAILTRSAASCRQLATRARRHVHAAQPRYAVARATGERLSEAFLQAITQGDIAALTATLAEDVTFYTDGGGKVPAVPRPLHGAAQVARVIIGFASLYKPTEISADRVWLNGNPGFVLRICRTGEVLQTIALEPTLEGRIAALYIQRNPDKLRHLARVAS